MNRQEQVAELLRTADAPMSAHGIANALGWEVTQIKHIVKTLVTRCKIHITHRTPSAAGRNTCWYCHGEGESAPEVQMYSKHSTAVKPVVTTVDRVINRQRKKVEMLGVWGGLL